jgi:hypothetical protein
MEETSQRAWDNQGSGRDGMVCGKQRNSTALCSLVDLGKASPVWSLTWSSRCQFLAQRPWTARKMQSAPYCRPGADAHKVAWEHAHCKAQDRMASSEVSRSCD